MSISFWIILAVIGIASFLFAGIQLWFYWINRNE